MVMCKARPDTPQKDWLLPSAWRKPGQAQGALLFVHLYATGHSAVAACLHSTLQIIAIGMLNVLVPPGETEPVGQPSGLVDLVSGDKPMDAATCQERSNVLGFAPPSPPGPSTL